MIDNGTAAKFFKDERVNIGFFHAPITHLNGFKYGKDTCENCQTEQKLFTLNPNRNAHPIWICIDCLQRIPIECGHNTSYGFVDLNLPAGLEESDARKKVSEKSYLEMCRTPRFMTLQGEQWLCHCNDFMNYLGTWEAPDFTNASKDGNGKKLFLEMTEPDSVHLWDELELAENDKWNRAGFPCRHWPL